MRVIVLRRVDRCAVCSAELAAGERAGWDPASKATTCLRCLAPDDKPFERGQAGASAARTYERRAERHRRAEEERVEADRDRRRTMKQDHPVWGRVANAITPKAEARPEPAHVRSWATGAPGEERVGEILDKIEGIISLHDRRIPGKQSNIDHIAVTPAAVWVIDAKRYVDKKVEFHDAGGWFRTDERLLVGGRNRTQLVDDMAGQVETVGAALATAGIETAVKPLLCFVGSTWELFAKPFMVRGVGVAWPLALPEILARPGPLGADSIERLARVIAAALPPA